MTEHQGRITIEGERAVLTFERWLPHPIETVWTAITDPDERAAWMGRTIIDARAGGQIEMIPTSPPIPDDAKRMTGRITVWDPPNVFEHLWHQRVVEPGVVRYELRTDGDGTRLRFSHRGLGVPNANGFRPGTHAYLDRLDAHLSGAELPDWSQRYQQLAQSIYAGGE